ncbi:MAG: hypothetical protein NTV88_05725 [Candidatus Micrarchaeota archaeon]|nr:hypothetical protein [Candidatus Micrarchaeota archaeon]
MAQVTQVEKTASYRLYSVSDASMLQDTYVLCANSCRDVLYSPQMAGKKLQDAMEKNSEIFAQVLHKKILSGVPRSSICELVFLSGGLYYALNYGFKKEFGFALPQCFIGIQRQRVEGKEGSFRAVSGYENFESLPDNANVIIGDTVASGATLVKGIQLLLDAAENKGYSIASITVLSLAGSSEGARKLAVLAKKHIASQHPQCRVSFFGCEMLFHVMPDGTDLRFLMPASIMPDESRLEAVKRYGDYLSKNMKCAVFDWGTRCKNPSAHCGEFLEYCNHELSSGNLDEKGKAVMLHMKKETEALLEEMKQPLGKK